MALFIKRWRPAAGALALLLLGGCASNVPDRIRLSPAYDLRVTEVQAAPQRHLGAAVRWGGEIISVQNKERETWFEILGHPLDSEGRPRPEGGGEGRFVARIPGFLDPAIYAPKRELTVSGRLEDTVMRRVGEFPYLFPLVRVEDYYLWPLRQVSDRWRDPWYPPWYDPFYDPWYPYYGGAYYPYPYPHPWWR